MSKLICQSCAMPMVSEVQFGTQLDGSLSQDYCTYCYQEGNFTDELSNLDDMIKICTVHMVSEGMNQEDAINILNNTLPNLKRWKVK
jgi:hypothetical protein